MNDQTATGTLEPERAILRAMLRNAKIPKRSGLYHDYEHAKRVVRQFLAIPRAMCYDEAMVIASQWIEG